MEKNSKIMLAGTILLVPTFMRLESFSWQNIYKAQDQSVYEPQTAKGGMVYKIQENLFSFAAGINQGESDGEDCFISEIDSLTKRGESEGGKSWNTFPYIFKLLPL